MTEAWFGLIGVVIGGFVTFGATYLLEWFREGADAKAARGIVSSELGEARRAVEDALAGEAWPPGWKRLGWSESWSTYRPVLAKRMDDADFTTLASAYLQMRLLETGLAEGTGPLNDENRRFLGDVQSALKDAEKVVA